MHARPVQFSFETQAPRMGGSLGFSAVIHTVIVGVLVLIALATNQPEPVKAPPSIKDVVWLKAEGPGGGGGGGGNRTIKPPPKLTPPPQKTPDFKPVVLPENAVPMPDFLVPAKSLDETAPVVGGSGTGGGSGSGSGTGIGSGTGSGIGDGWGGGFGGGAYRPGNGVDIPVLKKEVKPIYTPDAMRAKIQGEVWLDCVVRVDGSVGDCGVTRSLDSTFGLDQEAVKAARQWKFLPGKRLGQPVPVLITIQLSFTLR